MDIFEDIQRAREDVEFRLLAWNMANQEFEQTAWHAYLSACERLNALLMEARMQEQANDRQEQNAGFTVAS